MAKAKSTKNDSIQKGIELRVQQEQARKAYNDEMKALKTENALMEEYIRYYKYKLELPKLAAAWGEMQAVLKAQQKESSTPQGDATQESEVS